MSLVLNDFSLLGEHSMPVSVDFKKKWGAFPFSAEVS